MKRFTKIVLMLAIIAFLICIVAAEEPAAGDNSASADDEEIAFDDDEDESLNEEFVNNDEDDENEPNQFMSEDDMKRQEARNLGYLFPSPDVDVSYVLPETQEMTVGKKGKILLGFTNNGLNPFTIFGIRGQISHVQDFQYILQNFTAVRYNTTVQPEETNSLMFEFQPDARLEAIDFGVTIQVFYVNEDNDTFVHAFFNQTVSLQENTESFDVQQMYLIVTLLAIIGSAAYFFLGGNAKGRGNTSSSSSSSGSKSAATPSSPSDSNKSNDTIDYSFINAGHLMKKKKKPKKSKK